MKLAVCSPGLIPGMNAPPLLRLSAISFELKVSANQIQQKETIKITKKDRNSLEAIKLKIREAAESGLGVIRNEKDLKAAMDTFAAMEKKLQKFNLENPTTFEIWQMTRLASMMASAALEKQRIHYGK